MMYLAAIAGISSFVIGLLHYYLTSGKPIPKPPKHHAYVVPGTEGKTHTASRRQNKELLEYNDANVRTVYQLFQDSVKRFSDKECFGIRQKLSNDQFGEYQWKSYREVGDRVSQLASGILHLTSLKSGDRVGVYSINRPEWVETDFACQAQSLVPVALYDTLGKGAVEFIIEHAEIGVVVCSGERVSRLLDVREQCPSLHSIISMDRVSPEQNDRAASLNVKLYDYDYVLQCGKDHSVDSRPPSPDDLATIMYTSGTTGNPKGVMLTQRNLVSVACSVRNEPHLQIGEHDVHMSYLPLAHIFERAVVCTFFSVGASIGFYSGIIPKLFEDIQTLRPTFMVGAPRVFTRLVDKVKQKISAGSPIKRALFSYAYTQKNRALEQSRTTPVLDRIVFGKLKAALGGRVRWILSGSAPLDAEVQRFMEVCFCAKVIQGYGLTETTAGSCVTLFHDYQGGHVGRPFQCCEVRLEDVPDMKYFASENRGEICIRGHSVTQGYYKDEAKTKEVLSDDGWFATGDIGEFRENGTLAIIDRKKNIFKLSQGEYVAPEYLESVYSSSKFVQQIFVYGNSFRRFLVALIVPDPEYLEIWAKENNITGDTSMSSLCRNDRLSAVVLKDLNQINKSMDLKGFENIKNVHLLDEEFSVEKNTMTPTFKLRRYDITQQYKEVLESLYNGIES